MLVSRNSIIILLLLMCLADLSAQWAVSDFKQGPEIKFKTIDKQDGLSQNWVRCIFQDSKGFMWFGTSGGLDRYNGYEVKTYSLGAVNVNDIDRKSENELWICNDLGVFIYDQLKDSIYSFEHFEGQTMLCAQQDVDNSVWFGSNTGLYRYYPSSNEVRSYYLKDENLNGRSINYVNLLFRDSEDNIWIGTTEGLNWYDRSKDCFQNYHHSNKDGSISGNHVKAMCEDHEGNLWVGTSKDGLNLIVNDEKDNLKFRKVVDGSVVALLVDHQKQLWIGRSSNGGLLRLDLRNYSPEDEAMFTTFRKDLTDPGSLSDNSIFCVYEDNLKDLWIGTIGRGVNYFSKRRKQFFTVKEGISKEPVLRNNMINAILEEERYVWFGTEGGLDRYDKQTGKSTHYAYNSNDPSSIASDPVYELYKDSRGNLWVGTWAGGLNLYDYHANGFKRFPADGNPGSLSSENVFAICEDSFGKLWVGTIGGGLYQYDYDSETFENFRNNPLDSNSLFIDIIHDIRATHDGRLFIAAYGSLDIFNYDTKDFSHYPLNDKNSDPAKLKFVIGIFEDSRHNIWLCTNEGLVLFSEDEVFGRLYTTNDGLPGNKVQGILEDDKGNLWVSTNNGISKFCDGIDLPVEPVFINFDETDGLSANDFQGRSAHKDEQGRLFFGSSKGYSYFHPDSIVLNSSIPEIIFVEMELLQKKTLIPGEKHLVRNINGIDKIELKFNESDFVIGFAALNYLNPEKNQYRYKLNGYDSDWIDAGNQRRATYKNLAPGNYTLMVVGSNNDNSWNTIPKVLEIVVLPPFWQTFWFRAIVILLASGLLVLIYWWRIRRIQHEKERLKFLVAERTKELEQANITLEEQSEKLQHQNEELFTSKEEISKYKDHLEEEVMNRTMDLEDAKNRAEESDRLKSAFLANMSHEIRTPLNAIAGFTSILNDDDLEPKERANYMRIIDSNTKTLLRLIDDILDLSIIEANQVKLKLSQFSPMKIYRDAYHQFLPQMPENVELLLRIDAANQLAVINSDEHRFRQVLNNLVSNAIKFTEQGMIEIGFESFSNNHLVFYVRDTGIGISEDEQRVIFNRFTKIEDTGKLFRGAGLGLAICKRLIELLDGEIWIKSKLGKGSTFYFTQPIVK